MPRPFILSSRVLMALASAFTLAACPSPQTPTAPSLPHHDTQAEEAKLNASGIREAKFRLLSDLSFQDADVREETEFKGTSLEHKVVYYSKSYVKQSRVSRAEALKQDSSCEIFVSTAPGGVRAEEIRFSMTEKLLNGAWVTTHSSLVGATFALPLQGARFQRFLLICSNVLDLETLRSHVGHLFEITPAAEK